MKQKEIKQTTPPQNLERVFVYGTLKRGFGNGERLLSNARFIGVDSLQNFLMYSLGGAFPAIVPTDDPARIVHGEVFEVTPDEFQSLDRLEGYPSFYDRMRTVTRKGENVWVYYHHPDSGFIQNRSTLVEEGVW